MTERDEDKLNLALRLISGRSFDVSNEELALLGFDRIPRHDSLLREAELCIAELIKQALGK